jgi:hypothetical protein
VGRFGRERRGGRKGRELPRQVWAAEARKAGDGPRLVALSSTPQVNGTRTTTNAIMLRGIQTKAVEVNESRIPSALGDPIVLVGEKDSLLHYRTDNCP